MRKYGNYSDYVRPEIQQNGQQWDFKPKEFTVYYLTGYKENEYISQRVGVYPADTVSYVIEPVEKLNLTDSKGYAMRFYGKNAAHYNFDWQRAAALPPDTVWYKTGIDALDFKENSRNWRDMELAFLKKYSKENAVSQEFYDYACADITNSYAGRLYSVPQYCALSSLPKNYFDDAVLIENKDADYKDILISKFLFAVTDKPQDNPQEIYQNIEENAPAKYKGLILANFINYYSYASSPTHKIFLTNVIDKAKKEVTDSTFLANILLAEERYLINGFLFGVKDNPSDYPQEIYQNIEENAPAKYKEQILVKYINYYANVGLPAHKAFLTNVIAKAKNEVKDSTRLANVLLAEQLYKKNAAMLPDSVLDKTFLRSQESDEKIPLKTILEKHQGKALYIDFWASWCSPCRQNMKESGTTCQYLKEQNVEMLYFSVDTNVKSWEKAIQEDNAQSNNHYLCSENFKSILCKYFQVNSIPRYVLFDKQHKVFMLNAPHPTEDDFPRLKKAIEEVLAK
ncbi:hypothetical protein FACS18945_0280 [Bacteroidia bacterium]|nr:hypothetical protein FACS18945_0280 [Bacteroidia bacterium]